MRKESRGLQTPNLLGDTNGDRLQLFSSEHASPRFEQWSSFCLPVLTVNRQASDLPFGAFLFGAGRVALAEMLKFGCRSRGLRRLWVLSYYCDDVVNCRRCRQLEIDRSIQDIVLAEFGDFRLLVVLRSLQQLAHNLNRGLDSALCSLFCEWTARVSARPRASGNR